MAKFEIDIANDEMTVNETIENLKENVENANVFKVIENGPAAGCPVFFVEVPESSIGALAKWYDDMDVEEFIEIHSI